MTNPAHSSPRYVAVIVHLSGRYRGKIHKLDEERVAIDTGSDAEIRFSRQDLTPGRAQMPDTGPYAYLERHENTYVLKASLEADIWVNGARSEERVLASGDVLEIGEGGPVLRFRIYPPGSKAYKSVTEVFSDCAECVRHGRGVADRAGLILAGPTMELLTRTSPLVRLFVAGVIVVLVAVVVDLWVRGEKLERQIEDEAQFVREMLDLGESRAMSDKEISALRHQLSDNLQRISALEARSEARAAVIEASSRSVAFIQGGWGLDDEQGRAVRFELGPDGQPLYTLEGPSFTVEGEGPLVEVLYTGTGFVVSEEGHMLTNRHVALPWIVDAPLEELAQRGFVPVIRRFIAYLPGVEQPFDMELVRKSEQLDVALLMCKTVGHEVLPLPLSETAARPGDEVIVMGYPTGVQALLVRADPATVQTLFGDEELDFWEIGRRLSTNGLIEPLATFGVVGQVTSASVVYDAETTHGGSGGPVLDLEGRVLAVNAAILPQFGGSNLGVPAAEGLRLIREPAD